VQRGCTTRNREDLAGHVGEVAREADEGQVRRVEHDLEREQHDQRAAPQDDAGRADPEQDTGDGDVPGRVGPEHQASSSAEAFIPSTTPPTAATRRTIDVISKASRWSVRNSRPISAGLPNERASWSLSDSPPSALVISATMTSIRIAAPTM